jgi:hypothetical protein
VGMIRRGSPVIVYGEKGVVLKARLNGAVCVEFKGFTCWLHESQVKEEKA